MTERERIMAVYGGKTPDRVPFMLDLSHFFYHKFGRKWDLLSGYDEPETDLIAYHRKFGAGFYMPNMARMFDVELAEGFAASAFQRTKNGQPEIVWRYETPIGTIQRSRVWEPVSYSWAIGEWTVADERDLRVLAAALSARRYKPRVESYIAWEAAVGDIGVTYLSAGYSAMGQLLNYWMGVENTVFAGFDWEDTLREAVDSINENNLQLIRLLAEYPARVVIMGDNFSSDIQPPSFFAKWSADYYKKAIRLLHAAEKKVAVHVDGRLAGAIAMMRDAGADAIDAVTPTPMGDLSPEDCRREAGPGLILSGGVSPDLWRPEVPLARFDEAVIAWLNTAKQSPALIAAAGDQVPPGAEESRISRMRDLVETYGKY